VKQVRNKIFEKISLEYEEKLKMTAGVEQNEEQKASAVDELVNTSDRSRENSGS
jgi:hypothetical protein